MTQPQQPRLDKQLGDLSPNKMLATVRERQTNQRPATSSTTNTSTSSR
jgi:hypothetical protein